MRGVPCNVCQCCPRACRHRARRGHQEGETRRANQQGDGVGRYQGGQNAQLVEGRRHRRPPGHHAAGRRCGQRRDRWRRHRELQGGCSCVEIGVGRTVGEDTGQGPPSECEVKSGPGEGGSGVPAEAEDRRRFPRSSSESESGGGSDPGGGEGGGESGN